MGVSKVAVVGCGMMGRGIVEVAAAAGIASDRDQGHPRKPR